MITAKPKAMRVGDVMMKDIKTIKQYATALEAAELMRDLNLGFFPVEDKDGIVVGVLTDRDLAIRAIPRQKNPASLEVSSLMTPKPVCCGAYTELPVALKLMEERSVRRLVVTDDGSRPVGILSIADLALHGVKSTLPLYEQIAKQVREDQEACCQ